MGTPNIPPSPADDNIVFTALLPNRGRAKFVRAAILSFLAVGTLAFQPFEPTFLCLLSTHLLIPKSSSIIQPEGQA